MNLPPFAGRRANLDELTPQEARIGGLAASGLSNPEIAARLYISRATVEHHLNRVFRKLGICSRAQLTSALTAGGNVLWRRGVVSGVVDWQGACTGPAAADVAHCRVNLLGFGGGAAQRFTAAWQQAAGADWHPWGDIVTIIGFLDDLRENWGRERHLAEDMLARAVAELGGSSW